MANYNEKGQEIPDKTPIELPVGYNAPEPLEAMIRRMVRIYSQQAVKQSLESFEEGDDFETDEEELKTKHEMTQMEEELPKFRNKRELPPLVKNVVEKEAEKQETAETKK